MDPLAFLSWQFVMFSLFVAVIMYIIRTTLEYFVPILTTIKLWNSLLLMLLPIFIGAVLGFALKMYPYATGFTTSAEHIGYGAVAGLLSTVLFKVIKELLIGKVAGVVTGVTGILTGVTPPPPPQSNGSNDPITPPSGSLMGGQTVAANARTLRPTKKQ